MADQQPKLDSVTWAPIYDADQLQEKIRRWNIAGACFAVFAIIMAILIARDDTNRQLALFGVAAVAATGILLLFVGVGLLHGEAVRAATLDVNKPTVDALISGIDAGGLVKVLNAVRNTIAGLSAARVLLLLGTALLVASAATAVIASGQLKDKVIVENNQSVTPPPSDPTGQGPG